MGGNVSTKSMDAASSRKQSCHHLTIQFQTDRLSNIAEALRVAPTDLTGVSNIRHTAVEHNILCIPLFVRIHTEMITQCY